MEILRGTKTVNKLPLQGTHISLTKAILKMIFLFFRWDMLISRRVSLSFSTFATFLKLHGIHWGNSQCFGVGTRPKSETTITDTDCSISALQQSKRLQRGTNPKTNMEPKKEVWKMIFLFQGVIFRFHVSFQGCTSFPF